MKEKQGFFEQIARNWDNEHNTPEEIERTRQFAFEHFHLHKGETVLDVGCGTSRLVPFPEEMIGDNGNLVELDFSGEMLKIGSLFLKCPVGTGFGNIIWKYKITSHKPQITNKFKI